MQFPWAFLINGLELDMELNDEMENGTVNVYLWSYYHYSGFQE